MHYILYMHAYNVHVHVYSCASTISHKYVVMYVYICIAM